MPKISPFSPAPPHKSTPAASTIFPFLSAIRLRLKLFVKSNFFNVDAKRLVAGYRQGRQRAASRKSWTQREERNA